MVLVVQDDGVVPQLLQRLDMKAVRRWAPWLDLLVSPIFYMQV